MFEKPCFNLVFWFTAKDTKVQRRAGLLRVTNHVCTRAEQEPRLQGSKTFAFGPKAWVKMGWCENGDELPK